MRIKYVVIALSALLLVSCAEPPDFVDTEGNGYQYAEFEGKWLVINYWATWCAPCKHEIPELNALNDGSDNIQVFGVNFDQPEPAEMQKQIQEMKITFPVYAGDPYQYFGYDMPEVLPTTVIVSPSGELVSVLVGPQTEASLLEVIEAG